MTRRMQRTTATCTLRSCALHPYPPWSEVVCIKKAVPSLHLRHASYSSTPSYSIASQPHWLRYSACANFFYIHTQHGMYRCICACERFNSATPKYIDNPQGDCYCCSRVLPSEKAPSLLKRNRKTGTSNPRAATGMSGLSREKHGPGEIKIMLPKMLKCSSIDTAFLLVAAERWKTACLSVGKDLIYLSMCLFGQE